MLVAESQKRRPGTTSFSYSFVFLCSSVCSFVSFVLIILSRRVTRKKQRTAKCFDTSFSSSHYRGSRYLSKRRTLNVGVRSCRFVNLVATDLFDHQLHKTTLNLMNRISAIFRVFSCYFVVPSVPAFHPFQAQHLLLSVTEPDARIRSAEAPPG